MVEIRLLASEDAACNVFEEIDRDRMVYEMVCHISGEYLRRVLTQKAHIMVSFFGSEEMGRLIHALKTNGTLSLCRWEMGCTRVLQIWIVPEEMEVFAHSE